MNSSNGDKNFLWKCLKQLVVHSKGSQSAEKKVTMLATDCRVSDSLTRLN